MKLSVLVKDLSLSVFVLLYAVTFQATCYAQGEPAKDSLEYSFRMALVKNANERDEVLVNFRNGFTKEFVDSMGDALKYFNPGINIWWRSVDEYDLVINQYPIPENPDTLQIGVSAKNAGIYKLELTCEFLPPYVSVFLFDTYTNKLMDVRKTPVKNILINEEPASYGAQRFKLILMPVQAISVQVQTIIDSNREVNINWTSAAEVNTRMYTLEHSTDNIHFTPIDSVAIADTLNCSTSTYGLHHSTPVTGKNYYRMYKELSTGYRQYYEPLEVNIIKLFGLVGFDEIAREELSVYPNPAINVVHVRFGEQVQGTETMIYLYNLSGELSGTYQSTSNGEAHLAIDKLTPGTYQLTTFLNGQWQSQRFIKN